MAWHYIRPNKSTAGPGAIVFVAVHTKDEPQKGDPSRIVKAFDRGYALGGRMEGTKLTRQDDFDFDQPAAFWNWLERWASRGRCCWIWSCGAGNVLTWLRLWDELEKGKLLTSWRGKPAHSPSGQELPATWQSGILCLEDPPTIVSVRHRKGGLCKFVDTQNWWRCGMGKLAKSVGLDRLPVPDGVTHAKTVKDFLHREATILSASVLGLVSWIKEHDLGMFRHTAPSQSFGCWRHRFMGSQVCKHDVEKVRALERAGYYGGQLECFFRGEVRAAANSAAGFLLPGVTWGKGAPVGPVHKLDSNSMYPYVMREHKYPTKLAEWSIREDYKGPPCSYLDSSCIARVLIVTDSDTYPCRDYGRVLHPYGHYWTTLAGPELARAIGAGHVQATGSFARYETGDLFTDFVNYFWQLRYMAKLSERPLEEGLCKLMLNSLYGKFAQRLPGWIDRPELIAAEPWGMFLVAEPGASHIKLYRAVAGLVQEAAPRGDHKDAFPAVSAFVTAHGREHMRRYRSIAGQGNYYYQGVDSLYVSTEGLRNLEAAGAVDPAALGKLRLEGTAPAAHFHGHNWYTWGNSEVVVSRRAGAIPLDSETWTQEEWEHIESRIAKRPNGGVIVRVVKRMIRHEFDRGRCDKYGWVAPLVIQRGGDLPPWDTLIDHENIALNRNVACGDAVRDSL